MDLSWVRIRFFFFSLGIFFCLRQRIIDVRLLVWGSGDFLVFIGVWSDFFFGFGVFGIFCWGDLVSVFFKEIFGVVVEVFYVFRFVFSFSCGRIFGGIFGRFQFFVFLVGRRCVFCLLGAKCKQFQRFLQKNQNSQIVLSVVCVYLCKNSWVGWR